MNIREAKLEQVVRQLLKARNASTVYDTFNILNNEVEVALRELDELDPVWFSTEEAYIQATEHNTNYLKYKDVH